MIYLFEDFELDMRKGELRCAGAAVALEPQVLALLFLLVENRERMVSKDEIVEKVWDGRIVSDSAVTSRIKSARKALGDDGKTQRFIKTAHGRGLRFVADVKELSPGAAAASPALAGVSPMAEAGGAPKPSARPSIAILPFRLVGVAGPYAAIADALPHEMITELSRLRWLFVIARGSSFRFRAAEPDIAEVGRALNVRYCVTGMVEIAGDRLVIAVQLAETASGAVLWGERFSARIDDIYNIRSQIVSNIVSSMELQISLNEAQRASLASPDNLDAWSAYHLGLQHMHRFNSKDNAKAQGMFERAVALEPSFARAHAGLSCARFQNAFLDYTSDAAAERKTARAHAERAVELDPLDPYANFAMGRVHWIEDNVVGGKGWLDRAVSLSPNYAQGIYARAWAQTINGQGEAGAKDVEMALALSPLDPFRYAMLGVRAFSFLLRGDDAGGAHWADEAARAPGAHVLIAMIALAAHALNGDEGKAGRWAANVRERNPEANRAVFFRSFPFEHAELRGRVDRALAAHGF